jgi:single-strand DNA-binding protein
MQESGPDYGNDGGFGSSGAEPRRVTKTGGGGSKGGFDKALDDEIPF